MPNLIKPKWIDLDALLPIIKERLKKVFFIASECIKCGAPNSKKLINCEHCNFNLEIVEDYKE